MPAVAVESCPLFLTGEFSRGATTHPICDPRSPNAGVNDLFSLVYDELREMATKAFQAVPGEHTLQPTALVHETFLRLSRASAQPWTDRRHFLAVAAMAMRQILVNHAYARTAAKRGGGRRRIPLDSESVAAGVTDDVVLAVDNAVKRLAELDPECARVVEMRFFGGLTIADIADVLGKSTRSVDRCWQFARSWLKRELTRGD